MKYEEYIKIKHFAVLDSLRAISILLVITVHMDDNIIHGTWRFLSGEYGVTIFFVLSGFLITMLALREENASGQLNLRAFFVRRAFRIFPLYFFTLILICLVVYGGGDQQQCLRLTEALPYYLFYMNEFSPSAAFGQSWSLGIEEKFYFIWPFVAFWLLRNRTNKRLIFTIVLLVVTEIFHVSGASPILAHYRSILVGCLVAICLNDKKLFNKCSFLGRRPLVYFAVIALLSEQLLLEQLPLVKYFYPYVTGLAMTSLILSDETTLRWFRWRCVTFIGERSYGIYLIHILCLKAAEKIFPPGSGSLLTSFSSFALAAIFSLAFAELLYRFVERPLIAKGKSISAQLKAEAVYGIRFKKTGTEIL